MRIYGIDFTSRPTRRKPITCLECRLDGGVLPSARRAFLELLHCFRK